MSSDSPPREGRRREKISGLIRKATKSGSPTSSDSSQPRSRKRDVLKKKVKRIPPTPVATIDTESSENEELSEAEGKRESKKKRAVKSKQSRWPKFLQRKEEESTETPVVSSGPEDDESNVEYSSETESGEESEEAPEKTAATGKSRKRKLEDSKSEEEPRDSVVDDLVGDGPKEFQIRVRVMEGKELEGGVDIHPLCRIYLAGKIRSTKKRRATDSPNWNQNFYFTLKCTPQELPEKSLEFKVFSARKLLKDSLIGAFK